MLEQPLMLSNGKLCFYSTRHKRYLSKNTARTLGSNLSWITINRCTLVGKHGLVQKEGKPHLGLFSCQTINTPNEETKEEKCLNREVRLFKHRFYSGVSHWGFHEKQWKQLQFMDSMWRLLWHHRMQLTASYRQGTNICYKVCVI